MKKITLKLNKDEFKNKLDLKDGETPSNEKLTELIKPLIPEVKDGETPSNEKIVELIKPLIPEPIPGSPDSPDEIVEKLQTVKKEWLDIDAIRGDFNTKVTRPTNNFYDKRLSSLTADVEITNPTAGQNLEWNGTKWVNSTDNDTFTGSLATSQVAFGTGTNTIGGEAAFTYNASTNVLSVGSITEATPTYLKLDQTTPQTITGGTPIIPSIDGSNVANGDLTLRGTSNAARTTSYVNLQPNGGNVGVGTATPSERLHVAGAAKIDSVTVTTTSLTLGNIIAGPQTVTTNLVPDLVTSPLKYDNMTAGNTLNKWVFYNNPGGAAYGIGMSATYGFGLFSGDRGFAFSTGVTNINGTGAALKMIIQNDGDVGINVLAPRYKLEVAGGILSSGTTQPLSVDLAASGSTSFLGYQSFSGSGWGGSGFCFTYGTGVPPFSLVIGGDGKAYFGNPVAGTATFVNGATDTSIYTGEVSPGINGHFYFGAGPHVGDGTQAGFAFNATSQTMGGTFGQGGNMTWVGGDPANIGGESGWGGYVFMGGPTRGDAQKSIVQLGISGLPYLTVDGDVYGAGTLGNIGIRTTSPSVALEVSPNSIVTILYEYGPGYNNFNLLNTNIVPGSIGGATVYGYSIYDDGAGTIYGYSGVMAYIDYVTGAITDQYGSPYYNYEVINYVNYSYSGTGVDAAKFNANVIIEGVTDVRTTLKSDNFDITGYEAYKGLSVIGGLEGTNLTVDETGIVSFWGSAAFFNMGDRIDGGRTLGTSGGFYKNNGVFHFWNNVVSQNTMSVADNGDVSIARTAVNTGSSNGTTSSMGSRFNVDGSVALSYVAKTANYTLDRTNYTVDCTANSFDITLPTAVGCQGRIYNIKNSGTGTITVKTTSSQTIDGWASGYWLLPQYANMQVQSNNANWIIL